MVDNKKKNRYIEGFGLLVIMLALVRCAFPGVAGQLNEATATTGESPTEKVAEVHSTQAFDDLPHRILSVPDYRVAFPDTNALQLTAARRWGVTPVRNREDAESRKRELVYIGSNLYYAVDPLSASIPYLVPRAAILLQDIGQAFYDSLIVKGLPLQRLIVTSVLRTQNDVTRLRTVNGNATENSCHLYGTTFDICYNRYKPIGEAGDICARQVRNDTLKWVLSEVLRDKREEQRCYIKYEVKQGCFHMTVR